MIVISGQKKMTHVIAMIDSIKPSTIVDLAGNMGWYGSYMYKNVRHAIIVDSDYKCIDCLWKKIQNMGMDNVIPIYMSLCAPTLDYYRDDAIGKTAIEPWRKRSDWQISIGISNRSCCDSSSSLFTAVDL